MVHGLFEIFAAGGMQLNARSLKSLGKFLTVKPSMIGSQPAVVRGFGNQPIRRGQPSGLSNAFARLMRPDDMLETFSELAVKEPDPCGLFCRAV